MLWRGPIGGGAASGAVGAYVASHNKGGQYLRARTTPTNPASSFQSAVRNAVSQLTSAWTNTLTSVQRAAWNVYAANVTVTNRLGDSINLSGQQMYVRSNTPRLQAGMTRVDSAPVIFDLGDLTPPTLTLAASGSSGTLSFAGADSWATGSSTANAMLLYTSRPQNQSINFFKGPFRFAGKVNNTTGTASVTTPFVQAGTNSTTFWQVRVSRADGRLTTVFPGSSTPV